MLHKWPFSKMFAKFWFVKKHGSDVGRQGILALNRHEKILEISSSLKRMVRLWNDFTEMFLFKNCVWNFNLQRWFWLVLGIYTIQAWRNCSKFFFSGQILKWFHRNVWWSFKKLLAQFYRLKNNSQLLAPACCALVWLKFLASTRHVLLFKKLSLGDIIS